MRFLLACALVALSTLSQAQVCDTSPNSVGAGAILTYAPNVDPGLALFAVTGAPAFHSAVIIYSPITTDLPWGNGRLCVSPFAPGAGRMGTHQTGPDGSLSIVGVPPQLPGKYAQLWYRDDPQGDFNLSNSLFCDAGVVAAPENGAGAEGFLMLGEVTTSPAN